MISSNNTFSHDLEIGQMKENEFAEVLSDSTLECKFDRYSNGRHFVEFKKWDNAAGCLVGSGISTTSAKWYTIAKANYFITVSTAELKKVLQALYDANKHMVYLDSRGCEVISGVLVSGGDGKRSYGFLLEEDFLITTLRRNRENENK
jgi:hypothetical protein